MTTGEFQKLTKLLSGSIIKINASEGQELNIFEALKDLENTIK